MFNDETLVQLKSLAKEHNTTQASLVKEFVKYGLEHADVSEFTLAPAGKRGRKPGSTVRKVGEPETTPEETPESN